MGSSQDSVCLGRYIWCFSGASAQCTWFPLLLFLLADLTDPSVHDILPVLVGAVIVAPIVEEFAKPLVMFQNQTIRREIDELEDGIVYGAACGLGFGATENVMYGLTEGLAAAGFAGMAFLIVIRTVSSILLHLVTTSYTGHGIARYMVNGEPFTVVLKYYLIAVVVHATWNLAAVYSLLFGSETGAYLIFLFSIILAISGLQLAKKRIAVLDGVATVPVVSVEYKAAACEALDCPLSRLESHKLSRFHLLSPSQALPASGRDSLT